MAIRSLLSISFLVALSSANAVQQAELVWKKAFDSHPNRIGAIAGPFFLAGDKIAAVAENVLAGDKPTTQIVVTVWNSDSTVLRTALIGGAEEGDALLGGAAVDSKGQILVVARMAKANATRLLRFSSVGDPLPPIDLQLANGVLPRSLLVTRAGDLFVSGAGSSAILARCSESDSGWTYDHAKASETFTPSEIASDQRGNALMAGTASATGPIRVVKVSDAGKRVFATELDAVEVIRAAFDIEGKVVVLAKSAKGGTLLYRLDGDDGHVDWVETQLDSPDVVPKDLLVDSRKFIYILVDAAQDGKPQSYVVRYSLGGKALENLRPMPDANNGGSVAQDGVGEFYVAATSLRGELVISRTASNLVARYAIRSSPNGYVFGNVAVRDEDGQLAAIALKKDDQGGTFQPYVFLGRQAPVAKYDTYKATAGTANELPSVLGNDQYVAGARMSITQGPTNGKLEFKQDGSFTYTPRSGFTGKDTFRYQLTRGNLFWYAAVVTLNVE